MLKPNEDATGGICFFGYRAHSDRGESCSAGVVPLLLLNSTRIWFRHYFFNSSSLSCGRATPWFSRFPCTSLTLTLEGAVRWPHERRQTNDARCGDAGKEIACNPLIKFGRLIPTVPEIGTVTADQVLSYRRLGELQSPFYHECWRWF